MLDAVAELPEHELGNVERILRHEVDTDALGATRAYDCSDLLLKRLRGIAESRCASSKKKHELRLLRSPTSGKCSKSSASKRHMRNVA